MDDKKIKFYEHAEYKFEVFEKHNFKITPEQILDIVRNPDNIMAGYKERKIYQKAISQTHLIRVVC